MLSSLAICYFMPFAPHLLTSELYIVPRAICSYFSCFSFLFLLIMEMYNRNIVAAKRSERNILWISICFMIGLFCVNALKIQMLASDQRLCNRLDEIQLKTLIGKIDEYELSTGNHITAIHLHYDSANTFYHPEASIACGDINRRIQCIPWALGDFIEYKTGRRIAVDEFSFELYDERFPHTNWSDFSDEQFTFDGDSLYFLVY